MLNVIVGAAVAATLAGQGTRDLLCTGSLFFHGDPINHSLIAKINAPSDSVGFNTVNGWAVGPLGVDAQTYMGTLRTSNGTLYWYNLDRYTGELVLSIQGSTKVEFSGSCKPAQPMF